MFSVKKRILLTNDDGVKAEGIVRLADALKNDYNVFIIAPDRPRSASSHAVTLHKPLRCKEISKGIYTCSGTPVDCVILGIFEIIGKVDVVISGINKGPNIGEDILYSGTVAAAIEGALMGIPSVAISSVDGIIKDSGSAIEFSKNLIKRIIKYKLPPRVLLNVNIPESNNINDFKITRLGRREYVDVVEKRIDPRGEPYYWIAGEVVYDTSNPDSDYSAIKEGKISITPLQVDLTDYKNIKYFKNLKFK